MFGGSSAPPASFPGDGVEDLIVSEFGNQTGRLAWYERLAGRGSRRHLLFAQPGALSTVVRDVDAEGRPDVIAPTGQADEVIWLLRGRPGGAFAREPLLRVAPSYGSIGMELADVNGDGHPDIAYSNGDNPSPRKPYHGVRVLLNDGRSQFAERYFFPMPGAFKPAARDFDGDARVVLGSFAQLEAQGDQRALAARWRRPGAPTVLILEHTGGGAGGRSAPRRPRTGARRAPVAAR